MESTENNGPWTVAWRTGLKAAKQNKYPALFLWAFGSLLIVCYFSLDSVHHALEEVGKIKTKFGWYFSAISTAIFAGFLPVVIPIIAARLRKGDRNPESSEQSIHRSDTSLSFRYLLSNILFWGLKGIEVDLLYRFQAYCFGENSHWQTIAMKTATDQLIYVPLIGIVNVFLFYFWRECNYSVERFRNELGKNWYRRRVFPMLISNWAIWIPAVILIYCLPLALQLPVQNLILCFWVIILVFFTGKNQRRLDDHQRAS